MINANYVEKPSTFTVKWLDGDGGVYHTSTNVSSGTSVSSLVPSGYPSKSSTAKYTYSFTGWNYTAGQTVTSDMEITSNFSSSIRSYTITFKNNGGTVLSSKSWEYGSIPSYSGTPTAENKTAGYSYTFKAWSPTITSVTGNATYTATYNETWVGTVTITYYHDARSATPEVLATETITSGEKANPPTVSDYEDWGFCEWSSTKHGSAYDTSAPVTSDLSLYAHYEAVISGDISLTKDVDDSKSMSNASLEVPYGCKITASEILACITHEAQPNHKLEIAVEYGKFDAVEWKTTWTSMRSKTVTSPSNAYFEETMDDATTTPPNNVDRFRFRATKVAASSCTATWTVGTYVRLKLW